MWKYFVWMSSNQSGIYHPLFWAVLKRCLRWLETISRWQTHAGYSEPWRSRPATVCYSKSTKLDLWRRPSKRMLLLLFLLLQKLMCPWNLEKFLFLVRRCKLAQENGWGVMVSHRSGETEDTFIADLVVGLCTGQVTRSTEGVRLMQFLRLKGKFFMVLD